MHNAKNDVELTKYNILDFDESFKSTEFSASGLQLLQSTILLKHGRYKSMLSSYSVANLFKYTLNLTLQWHFNSLFAPAFIYSFHNSCLANCKLPTLTKKNLEEIPYVVNYFLVKLINS